MKTETITTKTVRLTLRNPLPGDAHGFAYLHPRGPVYLVRLANGDIRRPTESERDELRSKLNRMRQQ